MKVVTINVPVKYLQYIEMLTTGPGAIYPSRSECIRVAIEEFLERKTRFQNIISEELNEFNGNHTDRVRVPKPESEYKEYKIIRKMDNYQNIEVEF